MVFCFLAIIEIILKVEIENFEKFIVVIPQQIEIGKLIENRVFQMHFSGQCRHIYGQ